MFPGFREMAQRRKALTEDLVTRRHQVGLYEVAARMVRPQLAVARLEAGDADVLARPPRA